MEHGAAGSEKSMQYAISKLSRLISNQAHSSSFALLQDSLLRNRVLLARESRATLV
jgi:hypothetical protein